MTDNFLHNADCLRVMSEIKSGVVDCVICDPPYKMTKRGRSCRPNYMPDNMGENVFDGDLPNTKDWMSECFRVMKHDYSHMYVFTNTISIQEYLNEASLAGFKLHNIIRMIKDTAMPNRWYLKNSEIVLFFRKGRAIKINDMTSKDYEFVKMPQKRKGNKLHISQKPLKFIKHLVFNSTDDERDLVLDPFMGSGTTGVACKSLGRNFIGIEKDEKYFEIAKKRIEEA